MTLSDMQEVYVIDAMITNIHEELRSLYQRRAEILTPADELDAEKSDLDAVNLSEIDLTLGEPSSVLAL